jgi:hypothetical protein
MMAGFIHFDCLCGLDVYYFGDLASGEPPLEAIDTFRQRLGGHQYAIYTSRDDEIVECPCCGSLIQLPSPKIASFIGRMSLAPGHHVQDRPRHPQQESESKLPFTFMEGYRPQLSELN